MVNPLLGIPDHTSRAAIADAQRQGDSVKLLPDKSEGARVRTAEAIDRLCRVADCYHASTGPQNHSEDLTLDHIRVLRFVHEHEVECGQAEAVANSDVEHIVKVDATCICVRPLKQDASDSDTAHDVSTFGLGCDIMVVADVDPGLQVVLGQEAHANLLRQSDKAHCECAIGALFGGRPGLDCLSVDTFADGDLRVECHIFLKKLLQLVHFKNSVEVLQDHTETE